MSETKTIKIQLANQTVMDCKIQISQTAPWKLILWGLDFDGQEFVESDLFKALIALRLELERSGCRTLCAGARIDVFPSGMARSMGAARKAYITQLGIQATEMVDIFDYAPPELVVDVEQQSAFHARWIESIKAKSKTPFPQRD